MKKKTRRPIPGTDRIDDLVQAVEDGWRHEVDDIDSPAVGLFTRIFVLARLESVFYDHVLAGTERNSTEHYVLAMIRALGPKSPSELNVALIQSTGGITNTLTRLEKAGLVTRGRDSDDRRGVIVKLTAAGRREADRTMALAGQAMHARASLLTARQRDRANRVLDELIAILVD
jgi:DNA-binding MarR family transcriptional regulator